ncbi:MAG TPA: glycerol-3-phosphate dehydrogenase/oxidase [Candidatus Angelobacter sp.]|nr:glycerol-3-phosphate dehydrogenase/oxidase [Candidatus Angelobacter sp.]
MSLQIPARASLADQSFDALVIGGGINGTAIALQCVRGGLRTLLVEQHDFASGTTSRATRIIHGGLRYLEHAEIGLVRESLRERERLLFQWPHLVRPLEFLLVAPKNTHERHLLRTSMAIRTGLWLYRQWAGGRRHVPGSLREFESQLDSGHTWSVYSYEDGQCEFPERLVAEWLVEATEAGAVAHNHLQVLQIMCREGRAIGARLRDRVSGKEFSISAKRIINASGPWVDFVMETSGLPLRRLVGGVRGSHIILPRFANAPSQAVYTEAPDGRPIFIIPWNGQTLVGTTEVADSDDPTHAAPSDDEISYLWNSFVGLFPHTGLSKTDIRYTFAGVRPLPFSPGASMGAVTRKHIIHDHAQDGAAGLISIIGGKLTTAVSLARETARKLGLHAPEPVNIFSPPSPADGVESTVRQWSDLVAHKARIPQENAKAIAEWHGARALCIAQSAARDESLRMPLCSHNHHIVAEAVEAILHECAVTLADVLLRRVPVALGDCWSESCSLEAAQRIGAVFGWDQSKIFREKELFEEERAKFLHPRKNAVS